jgi:hypothetical protein
MTTITGEMAVMLSVIGYRQGDSRILDAIALVGPEMEVMEFDADGEKSTYFIFKSSGTDLLFEDDILEMIMVRTGPDSDDETYGTYPRPAALIEGLSPTATRTEVTEFLGEPERVGPDFDRYEVNNHYLRFRFDPDGRVAQISAQLQAP